MRCIGIVLVNLLWSGIAYGETKLPETIRTPELTVTGSGGTATPPALTLPGRTQPTHPPVKLPETITVPELSVTGTAKGGTR